MGDSSGVLDNKCLSKYNSKIEYQEHICGEAAVAFSRRGKYL
jgi:hypothetical protein